MTKITTLTWITVLSISLQGIFFSTAQEFSYESNPTYSPSGNYIVYVSNKTGNLDLWLFHTVSQEHRNLTSFNEGRDSYPVWSPDGQYIAFVSDFASNDDIWLLSLEDNARTNLTEVDENPNGFPTFSPDGTELAYITDFENGLQSKVQVIDIETHNIRTIIVEDNYVYSNAAWSYSGRYLAFAATYVDESITTTNDLIGNTSSYPDGIHIYDFDSANLISIGQQQHYLNPVWSPTSNQLLVTVVDGFNTDLLLIDIEENMIENLTATEDIRETLPSWSHDGNSIAYVSSETDDGDIWVMNLDTRIGTNLTQRQTHNSFDTSPTWSPNGKTIVFSSNIDGDQSIWTISVDGNTLQNLGQ